MISVMHFASPVPLDVPEVGSGPSGAQPSGNRILCILYWRLEKRDLAYLVTAALVSNPENLTLLFSVKTCSLLHLLIKVTGSKIIAILKWLFAHPTCGRKVGLAWHLRAKNWVSHGANRHGSLALMVNHKLSSFRSYNDMTWQKTRTVTANL